MKLYGIIGCQVLVIYVKCVVYEVYIGQLVWCQVEFGGFVVVKQVCVQVCIGVDGY